KRRFSRCSRCIARRCCSRTRARRSRTRRCSPASRRCSCSRSTSKRSTPSSSPARRPRPGRPSPPRDFPGPVRAPRGRPRARRSRAGSRCATATARPATRGSRSSTDSSEGVDPVALEVAVVGAGAWGTAIACHLAERAHAKPRVVLIARSRERADELRRDKRNARYLPDIALPDVLAIDHDLARAAHADLVLVATPIKALETLAEALADAGVRSPLVWLSKGFVRAASPDGEAALAHRRIAPRWPAPVGVVSGPSF